MSNPGVLKRWSALFSVLLLLNGCYDRTYEITLRYEDGNAIRCPNEQETTYRFKTPIAAGDDILKMIDDVHSIPPWSKKNVSVWLIRGSIESGMHPWVQFSVYCGNSRALVYESPKLTEKDFVITEKGSVYTYFVKRDAIKMEDILP